MFNKLKTKFINQGFSQTEATQEAQSAIDEDFPNQPLDQLTPPPSSPVGWDYEE